MDKNEFSKTLLNIAFAATVCDGDIDDREMDLIKNLEKEDFYIKGQDLEGEIDKIFEIAKTDFLEYSNQVINEIYTLRLSPTEKMVIINLAIAIVRADNKMQEQEIKFIKSLILNLQLLDEIVEAANGKWWIISNQDLG